MFFKASIKLNVEVKMGRRKFLQNLVLGVLTSGITSAMSQISYPNRPIKFVVPSTTGITSDTLARLIGPVMSQRLGVPIVIENKVGAGGLIGADTVAKSDPDGYTLLFANTSFGTLAATNPKLPYDPIKSFMSVSLLSSSVMTLVVPADIPIVTFKDFVEFVKKQGGKANYSSPGLGTTQHLAMELINQKTGISMLHVPYRGSSGAMSDLIAGHVQASVVALQTAAPFVESGRVKLIAVLGKKRVTQFSQIPTLTESGYGEIVVETWSAVMAPKGTPVHIVAKLSSEIDYILNLPEIKETLTSQGVIPVGGKPDMLDHLIRSEIKVWSEVVQKGKILVN